MSETPIGLSRGVPESVMAPVPPEWADELQGALLAEESERRERVAAVAARHPRYVACWAALVDLARDDVEAYAYARVGYHRGLDQLRSSGWRGTGYVRYSEPDNRGFLEALDSLRRLAGRLGETDEEERCELFLYQLDPDWGRRARS